jgi:hypothetical protein
VSRPCGAPLKSAAPHPGHDIVRACRESIQLNPSCPLAVKFQPIDDLVDHLALGAHRDPDQI